MVKEVIQAHKDIPYQTSPHTGDPVDIQHVDYCVHFTSILDIKSIPPDIVFKNFTLTIW
jgi:hypothetical protein